MANSGFKSVDEDIAKQPRGVQATLRRVRDVIRRAMPGAEEVISYQIPAYRLHGGVALYFAGWKQHYSLYPTTAPLIEAFGDALAPYALSKGTVRFPLDKPIPVALVKRLVKARVEDVRKT